MDACVLGSQCECANAAVPVRLAELSPGDKAVVTGYQQGNRQYRSRLLSMGLTRGTVLRLVRMAPLGDPVDIELRGYNLTLRKQEAEILLLGRA